MCLWKSKPKKLHVNVVLLAKERRGRCGAVSGAMKYWEIIADSKSRLELGLRISLGSRRAHNLDC